ncbi:hypothetical protein B0H14DRAFT_3444207 [Mycena olivaceomarginata]|nr:hypothetical protein B0H14DRAFT_3444207 [Mycena olivaceomarginata]
MHTQAYIRANAAKFVDDGWVDMSELRDFLNEQKVVKPMLLARSPAKHGPMGPVDDIEFLDNVAGRVIIRFRKHTGQVFNGWQAMYRHKSSSTLAHPVKRRKTILIAIPGTRPAQSLSLTPTRNLYLSNTLANARSDLDLLYRRLRTSAALELHPSIKLEKPSSSAGLTWPYRDTQTRRHPFVNLTITLHEKPSVGRLSCLTTRARAHTSGTASGGQARRFAPVQPS